MHNIKKEEDKRERITLLSAKDLEISYYCGSGKGGQARNKTANGVMIRHPESGAMAKNAETRSQHENKMRAFRKLVETPQMKFWIAKKLYELEAHEKMEETVAKSMGPENLKIEVKNEEGKWVEVSHEYFQSERAKQDEIKESLFGSKGATTP